MIHPLLLVLVLRTSELTDSYRVYYRDGLPHLFTSSFYAVQLFLGTEVTVGFKSNFYTGGQQIKVSTSGLEHSK